MNHFRWRLLPPDGDRPAIPGLSPLLAQLLHNRGLTAPADVESFLAADERLLHDPYLLPDMAIAVSRTYQALLRGEKIAVYGDFDADGITSSALLMEGLADLGGSPVLYIPHRMNEGHGLHAPALEKLRQEGVSLVITVDCGITGWEVVEEARKAGQDVIITDHHRLDGKLPPAMAAVNPYRPESAYPFTELAGVGVAYKFLQALLSGMGRGKEAEQYLDLVALGTIADMVVLLGENRYLVKRGLELMNRTDRPGLQELLRQAGLTPGAIDAESVSFAIGPRLNAAGRVDHAMISYNLLTTTSAQEAEELAAHLEQCNAERQRLRDEMLAEAREIAVTQAKDMPVLIVEGENFWPGVVGIVAGQLSQEYNRPALVIERGPEISHGSARSVPEFDIVAALQQCRDLLDRFGGHPQAAGFSLATQRMPELRERLVEIARRQLDGKDLRPSLLIDTELPLANLDGQAFPLLQKLSPFGKGNPTPTFLSRNVQVVDCRMVGKQGAHLRLKLKQDRRVWPAVGFDLSPLAAGSMPSTVDMVYQLGVDNWQGQSRIELRVLDFLPSSTSA
ncbi:MAG: single-stranded-DNA-specific exonuclease RecJ [Chloroflexi bacterium]|nr:single-stranded-DNA-specific exonuclease RecJ [Chloroflexota bacterium]